MLNREQLDYVQSTIGYSFKNKQLLKQAFIRKSYSNEHPEVQNNEILEFYGDEALDLCITKILYKKFSKISDKGLISEKNEGEITKLKSIYVSKITLAQCSYNAGFNEFLYLGKSDIKNEVPKSISVNEDLFEAIFGAVAIDCDWDFKILEKVCKTMLKMDTVNSYLGVLVHEKSIELGFGAPLNIPRLRQTTNPQDWREFNLWELRIGCEQIDTFPNPETGLYEYQVQIAGHCFTGSGIGPFQAKMDAERKALHFLCHEQLKRKIKKIDYSNPVSQLHEFVQKKIIMEPIYDFSEYHDVDGNPIWICKVSLEGISESFTSEGISKKDVKQEAALHLLKFFVETEIEESEKFPTPRFYSGNLADLSDEEKNKLNQEFDEAEKRIKKF